MAGCFGFFTGISHQEAGLARLAFQQDEQPGISGQVKQGCLAALRLLGQAAGCLGRLARKAGRAVQKLSGVFLYVIFWYIKDYIYFFILFFRVVRILREEKMRKRTKRN